MANDLQPLLYNVRETAAILGVGVDRVYTLIATGDLPVVRLGERSVRIPRHLLEALKAHRKAQLEDRIRKGETWMGDKLGECSDLVFTNEFGLPWEQSQVTRHFQGLVDKAGLPRMRFHDLRHSTATIHLLLGTPMKYVQELLGHSSMKMTSDLYSHIVPEIRRETAAAMDRALSS